MNLLQERVKGVEINTVDQFQGRDKSVILYSCVRSGLAKEDVKVSIIIAVLKRFLMRQSFASSPQKGEILQDSRRLNVAITRAKHKLIVVGQKDSLKYFDPFEKIFGILKDSQFMRIQSGSHEFDWSHLDRF